MRTCLLQHLKAVCIAKTLTPVIGSTPAAAWYAHQGTQRATPQVQLSAFASTSAACATEIKLLKALKVHSSELITNSERNGHGFRLGYHTDTVLTCVHVQRLEITFSSGEHFQYPAEFLRVLSPSADSTVRVSKASAGLPV